jgi:hypothetical protein
MSLYAEDNGIEYEEVENTQDPEIMIEYAKEGVIDNNRTNGAMFRDWDSGQEIANIYLDHCKYPIPQSVIVELDTWIAKKKEEEERTELSIDGKSLLRSCERFFVSWIVDAQLKRLRVEAGENPWNQQSEFSAEDAIRSLWPDAGYLMIREVDKGYVATDIDYGDDCEV